MNWPRIAREESQNSTSLVQQQLSRARGRALAGFPKPSPTHFGKHRGAEIQRISAQHGVRFLRATPHRGEGGSPGGRISHRQETRPHWQVRAIDVPTGHWNHASIDQLCHFPVVPATSRRDQSCDIWIRNRSISRRHAEIIVDDAGAVRVRHVNGICMPRQCQMNARQGSQGGRGALLQLSAFSSPSARRCSSTAWAWTPSA